jgi:hypothetical protein
MALDPVELMTKARYEDDMEDALEGAVILAGAGGVAGDAAGGAGPGFVIVSRTHLAGLMPRLQELANELAGTEVSLQYVTATA